MVLPATVHAILKQNDVFGLRCERVEFNAPKSHIEYNPPTHLTPKA